MNKLDSKHPILTVSPVSAPDLEPASRLMVLLPHLEVDLTLIANRVWELAKNMEANVLFLSLYSDAAQEPRLRRELVTLSAMVKDEGISTDVKLVLGKDWVDIVKKQYQMGDMIVCLAEQRTVMPHRPLSQILQSELDAPIYILSGLYLRKDSRTNWLLQAAAWAGSLVIILGLFGLQIRITHLEKDWFQTTLLLITIPVELWIIWVWNSLFE